jgi:uncharacterized protein (TIGR00725 family)
MKKLIAVFGPGDVQTKNSLYLEAQWFGRSLAENHFATLCGGYGGIMEAVALGASEGRGTVIGVTAEVYFARGREANKYLTREIRVKSANDRLMELIDLADAYVAIGNSTGTMLEMLTAWDYMNKRFIPQKPVLLIGQTWQPFYEYVRSEDHFVRTDLLECVPNAEAATHRLIKIFGIQHTLPELNVVQR